MSLLLSLSSLALKGAASQLAGVEAAGEGAEALVGLLRQRFTDNSRRLTRALQSASEQAWRAVELALAGTSWWDRCKLALTTAEQRAFRDQVQAFLQAHPLDNVDGHGPDFRGQCLAQLQAARKAGLLTRGQVDPGELARRVGDLSRFGDRAGTVEAEYRALADVAGQLRRHGYETLAAFLELRPASGPPVLLAAMRYFFQRQVEGDDELFRGLAYARLESLAEGQSAGFAGLGEALDEHGQRLEALLADVQAAVVRTHADVLDMKAELARQGQQMQGLGQAVLEALRLHQLERRELHGGDSLSVRDEGERRLVNDLVRRYRSLPADQRRRMPALLNAVGKLEVVAGDFESAQRDFREVGTLVAEPSGRAEAAHNAFRAALERRAWGEALTSLKEAIALDPGRFAPFPGDKYEPEKILGAGGFGVAFLCRNRHSGGRVVIKTLRREGLVRDLGEVFREAQALEELDHPAIIRVRDCDYADAARSRPYLVMDYFPGQNLADYVEQYGPLLPAELLPLARLVAEGLQRAHARGILHRDVKPANLLVRRTEQGWEGRLIDFGLALRAQPGPSTLKVSQDRTLAGSSIAGTIEYAAPEQMGKLKGVAVGPYSDVYGFGKTCCYALFGTPQPTFQHWQQLPPGLADLLGRCLSEQPHARPQDFPQVLAALDLVLAPRPAPAPAVLLDALPAEEPARAARRQEPSRREPPPYREEPRRYEEPRRRPRPRDVEPDEVAKPPAPGRRGTRFLVLGTLVLVGVAGLGLLAGMSYLLRSLPGQPNSASVRSGRPSFGPEVYLPALPGQPQQAEVKYEPIPEKDFPAVLAELKGQPSAERKREIAYRLAETEPTAAQKKRHADVKALRKAGSAKIDELAEEEKKDDVTQVSLALDPMTREKDLEAQKAVARALKRWATEKNLDGLIALTEAGGYGADVVRIDACKALANLKDPRGVEAVAQRLKSPWGPEQAGVQEALITFGPMAEDAVIPLLKERSPFIKRSVIAVLKEVGGKKSLDALQGSESDPFVRREVQSAMTAIRARVK